MPVFIGLHRTVSQAAGDGQGAAIEAYVSRRGEDGPTDPLGHEDACADGPPKVL